MSKSWGLQKVPWFMIMDNHGPILHFVMSMLIATTPCRPSAAAPQLNFRPGNEENPLPEFVKWQHHPSQWRPETNTKITGTSKTPSTWHPLDSQPLVASNRHLLWQRENKIAGYRFLGPLLSSRSFPSEFAI